MRFGWQVKPSEIKPRLRPSIHPKQQHQKHNEIKRQRELLRRVATVGQLQDCTRVKLPRQLRDGPHTITANRFWPDEVNDDFQDKPENVKTNDFLSVCVTAANKIWVCVGGLMLTTGHEGEIMRVREREWETEKERKKERARERQKGEKKRSKWSCPIQQIKGHNLLFIN